MKHREPAVHIFNNVDTLEGTSCLQLIIIIFYCNLFSNDSEEEKNTTHTETHTKRDDKVNVV